MLSLHLPFAIATSALTTASAAIFLGSRCLRSKRRAVALPAHSNEPLRSEDDEQEESDPFDIVTPDDLMDGIPLEDDKFWKSMRLRKLGLSLVLVFIVYMHSMMLGWLASSDENRRTAILSTALELTSAIYILILAARSIFDTEVDSHWESLVHLCTLTTVLSFLTGIRLLLPTRPPITSVRFSIMGVGMDSKLFVICDTLTFLLYLVAMYITGNTRRCSKLHYPPHLIFSEKAPEHSASVSSSLDNVCGIVHSSIFSYLFFDYVTPVVLMGYKKQSLDLEDLPLLPSRVRATRLFSRMRKATKNIKLTGRWKTEPGSGWELLARLLRLNATPYIVQSLLAAVSAILFYAPAFFLQQLVRFLEINDGKERVDRSWGWVYCAGLFFSNAINYLITGQLWLVSNTNLQVSLKIQLNTILFAKTLVRKDVVSSKGGVMGGSNMMLSPDLSAPSSAASSTDDLPSTAGDLSSVAGGATEAASDRAPDPRDFVEMPDEDFSSKAQIMTLMTTDVDRVAEFSSHFSSLIDAPIEIIIGSIFLYRLLGVSAFFGLAVTCLFLPLNHYGSKVVFRAQDSLMKTRDERVSLMNEILGAMRMLKFMAWERSFEARVLSIREKELHYQRRNFFIETFFDTVWAASPVVVTLVAFYHFAIIRGLPLTPSIAFTSLSVFNELKFALNALPETFISMLQSFVSARRIEKYLHLSEVAPVKHLDDQTDVPIILNNATFTWPTDSPPPLQFGMLKNGMLSSLSVASAVSTPNHKFSLIDLTLHFPKGELSLICGKLGSGKTLLLLGLLGEAELLSGQLICPRTPPDAMATFARLASIPADEWVVEGVCAYVPQTAWLQNASIRDNILFNLPFDAERYQATVEACQLVSDFAILEDGDQSEVGERGVTLSGGQKARVSLARAVYSRAAVLFLDDVLSAVDAHTASAIYENALRGPLLRGRTAILVSHHVQLCAPGASYIVALDAGRLNFAGDLQSFKSSGAMSRLVQSTAMESPTIGMEPRTLAREADIPDGEYFQLTKREDSEAGTSDTVASGSEDPERAEPKVKKPRKLVAAEQRAVGRIEKKLWVTYLSSCGGYLYWAMFATILLIGAVAPVAENGWLKIWSGKAKELDSKGQVWYMSIYAGVMATGLVIQTVRWLVLYQGSINASSVLHKKLLESILFAQIRFHDTTNRGRLLNRFGKDFEGLDSNLATNMGRTLIGSLSVASTFITVAIIGGPWFVLAAMIIGVFFYQVAKLYGATSRDLRRLDSVTRSPLYTIYGECISGACVLRSFGASTKFLREMQHHVDTNTVPYYWMLSVNRWLNVRFNLLSSAVIGIVGVVILINPRIDAPLAGFLLSFVQSVSNNLIVMVRRFVGLEQSMVALERVQEFSALQREGPEIVEPRPAASWPANGGIEVENLVIRYAPQLPNVLHGLNFSVKPGSKIGVLGRTGGGKSTLALSFFRFVEATEGRILIDDIDISKIGLSDLRSRLTIIPQDPTILSGTLRSTLDVFNQYEDAEIFEALRRVHLIPPEDEVEERELFNTNVFRNLDAQVAEGGENFSSGEKQLLCMARAILKRSKVLLMDEATASVDYATDELISKTIREEFADSTILTIAHRLRTVIDYDKVLLLDRGNVVEYDEPATLLANPNSQFYALCQSAGRSEFRMLNRMAEKAASRRRGDLL